MTDITITVKECKCPVCGANETHPEDAGKGILEQRLLIRGFKVCDDNGHWWSQCLVCSGCYDKDLKPTPDNHDPNKGWF